MIGLRPPGRLLVATHNAGKLEEFAALMAPLGFEVVGAQALGLAVPEETETTFEGNALLKARAAVGATGLPALADDSGLEVEALDGAPGVHTADWAEGPNGRDFDAAMRRVREALLARGAEAPWQARFTCVLALVMPGGEEHLFRGEAPGRLVWPPRGPHGHGFDPMFVPAGHAATFAEMSFAEKNRISHRSAALRRLVDALRE